MHHLQFTYNNPSDDCVLLDLSLIYSFLRQIKFDVELRVIFEIHFIAGFKDICSSPLIKVTFPIQKQVGIPVYL